MNRTHGLTLLVPVMALSCAGHAVASELCMTHNDTAIELSFCGSEPFRTTDSQVSDSQLLVVP